MGAYPLLRFTLFIAMFWARPRADGYQLAYVRAIEGVTTPYPDIST